MQRLILIIALFCAVDAEAQNLILASDTWPPFTNEEGKVHFAQDIVQHALQKTNQPAEIRIIDFDDVVMGIKDGTYEGSVALWKNSEREEFMLFSKAYLENQLVLVGRVGSPVNYNSLADLRGKKLAIVNNYDYGTELFDLKTLVILRGRSDQDCLNMLLSGKVDYILLDNLFAHHIKEYQQNDVSKFLVIGERPLLIKSLHFAIRKDVSRAAEIINDFNVAIDEMLKDGTYNELLNVSWILADIDNDGNAEVVLGGDKAGENPPDNIYQVLIGTDPVPGTDPKAYYIQGQEYKNWQSVPEQYKLQPYNNTNNINILKLELNKK